MKLIMNADNPLLDDNSPNEGELHMNADDEVTVIMPDGTEIYVSGNGHAIGANGQSIESA